ncbi:MAG: hypothetical protein HYX41_00750 [Bdellovibrio sp.]|nr:hypothetical protein [Bdellovibrio sp.]
MRRFLLPRSSEIAKCGRYANLYGAIGNGGYLYKPYIVKEIESFEGKVLKSFQPEQLGQQAILHHRTVELVKQGLWGVINTPIGTAYQQRLPGMDFVGKTGTAQVIRLAAEKINTRCESMKFRDRHNAMFVGFAPVKDPVISVAVIGEHACHGGSGAAPIARAVIKKYLEKKFPQLYGEKVLASRLKSMGQSTLVPKAKVVETEDEGYAEGPDPEAQDSVHESTQTGTPGQTLPPGAPHPTEGVLEPERGSRPESKTD